MDVNPYSGAEAGKDTQKEEGDITARFGDVRRVDEKDVVSRQLVEDSRINRLNRFGDQSEFVPMLFRQQRMEAPGVRFNARDGTGVPGLPQCIECCGGGVARTDFDDSSGLKVLNETTEKESVGEWKPAIVVMEEPVGIRMSRESEARGLGEEKLVEVFLPVGLKVEVFPIVDGVVRKGGRPGKNAIQFEER